MCRYETGRPRTTRRRWVGHLGVLGGSLGARRQAHSSPRPCRETGVQPTPALLPGLTGYITRPVSATPRLTPLELLTANLRLRSSNPNTHDTSHTYANTTTNSQLLRARDLKIIHKTKLSCDQQSRHSRAQTFDKLANYGCVPDTKPHTGRRLTF